MIVAAGALVLLGLGLFVAGLVTDTPVLYWLCVAACVAAGVLLMAARVQISRTGAARPAAGEAAAPAAESAASPAPTAAAGTTGSATGTALPAQLPPAGATAVFPPVTGPVTASEAESAPVAASSPTTGAHAAGGAALGEPTAGDPPVEEVEVTDLLLVVDLRDEVLVVDEHPRYHVPGCSWLAGRATVPLPVDEARTDGFTPCARCSPDRTLAERERGRRGR